MNLRCDRNFFDKAFCYSSQDGLFKVWICRFFGAPVRARTDAWPVLQQPSIERDQATALPPVFRLSDRACPDLKS
jgi:hypothetical protein